MNWMGLWCNKWLALILLLLLEALFLNLAYWQFTRMEEKKELAAQLEAAQNLPPISIQEALKESARHVGRKVKISGWFKPKTLFLENQRHGDYIGYKAFSPFTTTEGLNLVVDRGWLPRTQTPPRPEDYAPATTPFLFTGILQIVPARTGWLSGPTEGNMPDTLLWLDLTKIEVNSPPFYVVSTVATHPEIAPAQPTIAMPAARHKGYMLTWLLLAILLPILAFVRWRMA